MNMTEINYLREAVTVLSMVTFIGIVWMAYRPSRQQDMQVHASSILEEDEGQS